MKHNTSFELQQEHEISSFMVILTMTLVPGVAPFINAVALMLLLFLFPANKTLCPSFASYGSALALRYFLVGKYCDKPE